MSLPNAGVPAYILNRRRAVSDTSRINSYDQPCIEFFGNYDFHTFGELPIASPEGAPVLVNLGKAAEEKIAALHAIDSYAEIAREIIKGRYFFTHKEYGKAANHWQEALALDPGNKTAEQTLALARGVMSQELSRRLASIEQDPDDPRRLAPGEVVAIQNPQSQRGAGK